MTPSSRPVLLEALVTAPGSVPWGDEVLALEIVGASFLLTGLSRDQKRFVAQSFRDHIIDPAGLADHSTMNLNVRHWDRTLEPRVNPENLVLHVAPQEDRLYLAGHRYAARIALRPRMECIVWTHEGADQNFFAHMIIENVLRVMLANRLLSTGGLLLHSAAFRLDDHGILFVGQSGAGKSTISRLGITGGAQVFSDDINALTLVDGRYQLNRLPFSGELRHFPNSTPSVPLSEIFLLRKSTDDTHSVAELGRAAAFSRILSNCPFVNSDPLRFERLTETIETLCVHTRVRELHFAKRGDIIPFLRTIVNER